MMTSVDTERTSDKIQHLKVIKKFPKKLGTERTYLSIIKVMRQGCNQHYKKWERPQTSPLKPVARQGCALYFYSVLTRSLS